jgi:hypothetical protein
MSRVRRHRLRQRFWILFSSVFLLLLVAVGVLFRAPEEERRARDFTELALAREPGALSREEREELRRQWERFSPETRTAVLRNVARGRLAQFRAEARQLPAEARRERIREATEMLQRQPARDLPAERREAVRARLASAEGQQLVREVLTFYQTELTAEERAELDPLVRAWLQQVEEMMQ